MKNKETEVYAYSPITITFKELGYSEIQFSICGDDFRCEFYLGNKTIHDIQHILLNFCDAYEIAWEHIVFQTSGEIFKAINQKTLSSEKTVWELFRERNIEIKETITPKTWR